MKGDGLLSVCAFSGHRPSRFVFGYDETHPLCKSIKQAILEQCRRLYDEDGVRTIFTGCALGVDLWGAEAVIYLKDNGYSDIRLICAVPYPNHDCKWTGNQRERLNHIITSADEVVTVCDYYSDDAYKRRNFYMIDRSQFLITVFDQGKNQRTGTLQTVNYAKMKHLEITFINPETANIEIKQF